MLGHTGGNKREAAERLGISYKAILYKIREFGIGRPRAARKPWRRSGATAGDGGGAADRRRGREELEAIEDDEPAFRAASIRSRTRRLIPALRNTANTSTSRPRSRSAGSGIRNPGTAACRSPTRRLRAPETGTGSGRGCGMRRSGRRDLRIDRFERQRGSAIRDGCHRRNLERLDIRRRHRRVASRSLPCSIASVCLRRRRGQDQAPPRSRTGRSPPPPGAPPARRSARRAAAPARHRRTARRTTRSISTSVDTSRAVHTFQETCHQRARVAPTIMRGDHVYVAAIPRTSFSSPTANDCHGRAPRRGGASSRKPANRCLL